MLRASGFEFEHRSFPPRIDPPFSLSKLAFLVCLDNVTKPIPHPIDQTVEDVVLTDAEQFSGFGVGTVKDQPHSSGVHGVSNHICQATDVSG